MNPLKWMLADGISMSGRGVGVAGGAGVAVAAGAVASATTGGDAGGGVCEEPVVPEEAGDAVGEDGLAEAVCDGEESAQADGAISPQTSPEERASARETPSQGFKVVRESPRFDLMSSPSK